MEDLVDNITLLCKFIKYIYIYSFSSYKILEKFLEKYFTRNKHDGNI